MRAFQKPGKDMKTSVPLLVLLSHFAFSEKYSLEIYSARYPGIPDFPDFIGAVEMNRFKLIHAEEMPNVQHPMKAAVLFHPDLPKCYKGIHFEILPYLFEDLMNSLRQNFNQTKGVHTLKMIGVIEMDDETEKIESFFKYGYDEENFISLDLKSLTLTAHKPKRITENLRLDPELEILKNSFTLVVPGSFQKYVKSYQPRTVPPSVSLLQKSPSSLVTCHATGFFPDGAEIFWRRDGKKLFEDVNEEILPNHDGTFQMSVDLNVSSVPSEDWGRYECVFQLSGLKEDTRRLNKGVIRTNHDARHHLTIILTSAIAALCCLIGAAHKYLRAPRSDSTPESSSEQHVEG